MTKEKLFELGKNEFPAYNIRVIENIMKFAYNLALDHAVTNVKSSGYPSGLSIVDKNSILNLKITE